MNLSYRGVEYTPHAELYEVNESNTELHFLGASYRMPIGKQRLASPVDCDSEV
jgi:hypothetical protein